MSYSSFIEEMAGYEKKVRHISFKVKGVKFDVYLSPRPNFAMSVPFAVGNIWDATIDVGTEKQRLWLGKFSLNDANKILDELKEKFDGEES